MHAVTALSLLALAGSALALPAPHRGQGGNNVHVVYETKVYTVVVTPGQAKPTPPPQTQEYHPAPTTTVVEQAPTSQYVAPSTVESSPPAATPTGSTDTGYMGTVNTWRQKMGLATLSHDDTLEANARKTCDDGNGKMAHELNPGSNAQVLAPGGPDDFEKVFVGGWLCEVPTLKGLDGICATATAGWDHSNGETGHADILSSTSYTKIGCANVEGIWGCDLTF